MQPARMGCFHQTRLSFMRALLRELKAGRWTFARTRWRVDARGVGVALYEAKNPQGRRYTLAAFAHDLPAEKRSDRVIAEAWDATFALYDGAPDEAEIARLQANVPKQEAGHCTARELVLARANRSVRLFSNVVDCLANGRQPPRDALQQTGYLMRTTAVYGNGKFGLADRECIACRPEFAPPFRAELLCVYLIRWFAADIVSHLARVKNPAGAVALTRDSARRLGIGNATGLGMAPFLVQHPALIHRWMHARETALARVRAVQSATAETRGKFVEFCRRMAATAEEWHTDDAVQAARVAGLREDLRAIIARAKGGCLRRAKPWDALVRWSETALSTEGQEALVSLLLEPHAELVDDLTAEMATDEMRRWRIRGAATAGELHAAIEENYAWALRLDFSHAEENARFWYVSEEKLEPRLGERADEPGAEKELPLDFARQVSALHRALAAADARLSVAEFLHMHPRHRHAVRRVQIAAELPYAEIRDNLIGAGLRPADLLRCKLSFFGATKFDPKSDRWVRITMYQHAPYPDELAMMPADDWAYPPVETAGR